MRIKELATATEVPVATLKYYLREGLLHGGSPTAVNQADYDDSHVRRVRLVKALMALGHLSIAEVRHVVDAVENRRLPIHLAFGVAQDTLVPQRVRTDPRYTEALADVDALITRNSLRVRHDAQVRWMLADALVAIRTFGMGLDPGVDIAYFESLLPGVLAAADLEVSTVPAEDGTTRLAQMEHVVVGTVAFETALNALRRLALEHASAERFAPQRSKARSTS